MQVYNRWYHGNALYRYGGQLRSIFKLKPQGKDEVYIRMDPNEGEAEEIIDNFLRDVGERVWKHPEYPNQPK